MVTYAERLLDDWRMFKMIVKFDPKYGPLVRVRCPNCGSRDPIIKSELDESFTVLYQQCGAWVKVEKGEETGRVECRVRRKK